MTAAQPVLPLGARMLPVLARRPPGEDDVADPSAAIHKHPAYSSIGAKQKTSGHGLHAH